MNFSKTLSILVVTCFSCPTLEVSADLVLFEHSGNADPTTEGWMIGGSGGIGVSTGPITNDGGSGFDSWFVEDTSTVSGSNLSYFQLLSGAQSGQASAGWTLSTTIRVPNIPESVAGSPFVLYRDGAISWEMFFGSDADGDPTILLWDGGGSHPDFTGQRFTLEGAENTYHRYDLIYDPIAGTADLFVDGIERLSDYGGFAFSEPAGNVGWGAGSSPDLGQGNFNHVQFSVVPEPSPPLMLTLLPGLILLRRRQR